MEEKKYTEYAHIIKYVKLFVFFLFSIVFLSTTCYVNTSMKSFKSGVNLVRDGVHQLVRKYNARMVNPDTTLCFACIYAFLAVF